MKEVSTLRRSWEIDGMLGLGGDVVLRVGARHDMTVDGQGFVCDPLPFQSL